MFSQQYFVKAKFDDLRIETAAARKEVPEKSLGDACEDLEVVKIFLKDSLVKNKAAYKDLYYEYFSKEGAPIQGNRVYTWDPWDLPLGFDKIFKQTKDAANQEIKGFRL